MSSIASPRRIDLSAFSGLIAAEKVPTVIATAIFVMVMTTPQPFNPAGVVEAGGNIVNQLGYGALGAVSVLSLVFFATKRVVSALFSTSMITLLCLMLLSVANATDPSSAVRAASFTLIGILAIATMISIPRDADAFSTVILVAGLLVIGLCYIGLVIYPDIAKHTAASQEPQHAGLWRGVFPHKNVAGPVMACLGFCGLYLARRGWRWSGAVLFVTAMWFMLHTGSKTTAGLVPVAMIVVVVPGLFGVRWVTALLFWAAVFGTAFATLGIVFIEPLKLLAAEYFPDLTYTGRTTLWEFGGEMILKQPWTGYGYDSFWGTPFLEHMSQPFDREWDIRTIVHGHNGYIDIALQMGLPALAVAGWTFLIAPVIDYMRVPRLKENVLLADLCLMILMFTALNAFLESFFFRRADVVWLYFIFSLLGMRLAARFPIAGSRPVPSAGPNRGGIRPRRTHLAMTR